MYIHDYYYAYASRGTPGSSNNAKNAWIHLSENNPNAINSTEWTMSRYGGSGSFYALYVSSDGAVGKCSLLYMRSVRPVFYLTSDVKITGGTGTASNPYELTIE